LVSLERYEVGIGPDQVCFSFLIMLKVKLFEKIGLGGKDPMVLQILDLFLSG
jgi:hypothetical protein